MLEEPLIFLSILIISLILRNLLDKGYLGLLYPIALRLAFIGVVVHELSHYLMNLMVGIKPRRIQIKWRNQVSNERSPHGLVQSKPRSFLQAFLIGLAPLYISTWLIFLSLNMAFSTNFSILIRVIAAFFCISLLIGAAPSTPDFRNISGTFMGDPAHSFYQLVLIILSGGILWAFLLQAQVNFILDVFYYLSIAGIYFLLKYSLKGSKHIMNKIISRNFTRSPRFNHDITHGRYKPKRPQKLRP